MRPLEKPFGSGPAPSSSRTTVHPGLGELAWSGHGPWDGQVPFEGTSVVISLAGGEAGPDRCVASAALVTIAKLGQLREEAIALISQELRTDAALEPARFALIAVCYPSADRPEEFWLELSVAGDHDDVWRVEFGPVGTMGAGTKDAEAG